MDLATTDVSNSTSSTTTITTVPYTSADTMAPWLTEPVTEAVDARRREEVMRTMPKATVVRAGWYDGQQQQARTDGPVPQLAAGARRRPGT